MEIEINFQLIVMWYVVLLIHELGHVIANKLIGAELVYVSMAYGHKLWILKNLE